MTPSEQLVTATRELCEFRERTPSVTTVLGHVTRLLGAEGLHVLNAYCALLQRVQRLREVVEE
jgi:hypothetical protein